MATIPSLALIPSGYKGGSPGTLYSVLPTDGTGDFDFTRSGNATRVNSEGLIELVTTNVPRLNYPLIDGVVSGCPSLLLELERTNLQVNSEEFDNILWSKVRASITPNDAISPSGLLNADKLVGVSGTNHYVYDSISVTFESTYTISVFAKYIDIEQFIINVFGQSGSAFFDISNGTVTSSTGTVTEPKIENYGNGWYRCSAKFTATATESVNYGFYLNNAIDKGVHIWGAQVELGSYATSYIPTTTTIGTRSAETCNNAGDVNTFNDSEGVLFAEISALANDSTFRFISLSDGTSSNRISLFFSTSNTLNGSVNGISSIGGFVGIQNNNKVAFKYKSGDYALWVNGIEVGTSTVTTGNHANLNRLNFDFGQGSDDFYGNTKQIQYFNTVLNDSDLETLTSWDSFSDMATSQLYTIE
jgi:hypothetical protein